MTRRGGKSLLESALAPLGLTARGDGGVRDSDGCLYRAFRDSLLEPVPQPVDLAGLSDIRYFEHYSFPNNYRVVDNPFYGMSSEEIELRLAVAGT